MKSYFRTYLGRVAAILAMICALAIVARAAQTLLTAQTPLGPYPGTVSAGQLAFTFAAADNVNGNSFAYTGHEVLLIQNTDAAAQTVTISSVADQFGRTQDVTAYSIPASGFAVFNFRGGGTGWKQNDGTVHFTASTATIKFAVLSIQ